MSLPAVPANSRELGHPALVEGETPSWGNMLPYFPGTDLNLSPPHKNSMRGTLKQTGWSDRRRAQILFGQSL